jgi:hypothetical protein
MTNVIEETGKAAGTGLISAGLVEPQQHLR